MQNLNKRKRKYQNFWGISILILIVPVFMVSIHYVTILKRSCSIFKLLFYLSSILAVISEWARLSQEAAAAVRGSTIRTLARQFKQKDFVKRLDREAK